MPRPGISFFARFSLLLTSGGAQEDGGAERWEGYVDWRNRPAIRGRHGGSSVPALDASLSPSSSSARFDRARAAATASISAVAEVAAHRLIFLDSRHSLYQGLYARGVGDARIRPALRLLKQNLSFLVTLCWC